MPAPYGSPELLPRTTRAPETIAPYAPEKEQTAERPASNEVGSNSRDNTGAPPLPVVPLPLDDSSSSQPGGSAIADDTNPSVASDDDLIEKEWVEQAKRIITETKDDPYAQERAVSKLQADYMHKRYGKVIKLPKEE